MGVVAVGVNLSSIDIGVVAAREIHLQCHLPGKIEIGVERARTVAGLNGLGRGEFVDVVGTGPEPVQALLDAIAFSPDLREGQVDFSYDSRDIKPAGIADTAAILGLKTWAEKRKPLARVLSSLESVCKGAEGEETGKERRGEVHFVQ